MAYGDTLTLSLPTVGVTPAVDAYELWNEALEALAAVVSGSITPSSIVINANIDFKPGATSYAPVDVNRVAYDALGSLLSAATYPRSTFVYGGELYFNDGSGNQVQITDGGSIVGTPGSITGTGYGTPVEVNWAAGAADYHMYADSSASPALYADVNMADCLLSDGSSNFLRLSAGTMASDYTLTFPDAVPGANNTILQASVSGSIATVSFSNTVASLTTNSGGVTAAANQHVTVSGTGRFKHGEMQYTLPGTDGTPDDPANFTWSQSGFVTAASGSADIMYSIVVPLGCRITTISWNGENGSATGVDIAFKSLSYVGVGTNIASGTASAGAGAKSITLNPNTTIADNHAYLLHVNCAAANDITYTIEVFYDWP